MANIVLTATRQGLLTIDRTMSRFVLLLWVSTLERQLGSHEEPTSLAE